MTYDAIVIGGGVVGMSIAYHLVRAGAHTLLLDRADAGRATDAGAGILTAGSFLWPDPNLGEVAENKVMSMTKKNPVASQHSHRLYRHL